MANKEEVLAKIREAFGGNEYPGDAFLQGSSEGCEPYDEVGPFQGKSDWGSIESSFLDEHAGALNFFSEAGLRFFLPAYLAADTRDELKIADPVFSLTHGFSDLQTKTTVNGMEFALRTGKSEFINPRRYGAATFHDYARYRLSIFTREEAQAIVAYLEYKQEIDSQSPNRMWIATSLEDYWHERAKHGPTAESLRRHLQEKSDFLAAINMRKTQQ